MKPVKIRLELAPGEAAALAQMVKRFGHHHAVQLSSRYALYDGVPEHDVMLDGILKLQRALRDAGHDPR